MKKGETFKRICWYTTLHAITAFTVINKIEIAKKNQEYNFQVYKRAI